MGTESFPWVVNKYEAGFPNLSTIDVWDQIILCCGAGLCIVQCLPASIASTNWMPVAYLLGYDNQKCIQTLPNVPWRVISPPPLPRSSMDFLQ